MKKRFLALILALAMVISMVPAMALAADETPAKEKYVTLDGDWHFKLYRVYDHMFQYPDYGYPYAKPVWENNKLAVVPTEDVFSQWETFQMPADDETTGGLLPQARPVVEEEAPAEEAAAATVNATIEAIEAEEEAPAEETPAAEEEAPAAEEVIEEADEEAEEAAEEETPAEETPAEPETMEEPMEEEAAEEETEEADIAPMAEEEEPADEGDGSNPTWLFPTWSEAWVCRTFDVPANFTDEETVTLLLGTIDDVDVVYINGQFVASSGFRDINRQSVPNDLPLGGFDYTNADTSKQIHFDKSYWEIGREYTIPASVLKEGKNTIQIRVFNNNSLGGFYSGKVYALCGNQYAVRNLKGLPADKADSPALDKAVADQIAAIEANDMTAFAATVADTYADDATDKAAYVAEMTELLAGKADIQVTDTNASFLQGEDVLVYTAKRTITAAGEVIFEEEIELSYLEENGAAYERGNWSHCYTTSYTSELFNGETLTYSVYLPPSYYTDTEKDYPVVYLLHGQNSSSTSYINVDGIEGFMDNLINSGRIMDMILIMPDSGKNAFYKDSEFDMEGDPTHISTGPWASTLINELMPAAESAYRIKQDARYRGMTGNSMGGGGSFYLGCSHPELFSSIASHMGYLPQSNTAALEALTDEQIAKYDFYLDCGLQDTTVGTTNTTRVHNYLESRSVPHYYELRDGIHGSAFYMGSMDKSMAWHSAHFQKAIDADKPVEPTPDEPTEPEEPVKPVKKDNTITASNVTKTCSAKKQTFNLNAKAEAGKLTYSSSSKCVTVDKNGKVTIAAKFIGKATITIKSATTGDYKGVTKKITVTVTPTKTTVKAVKNVLGKKLLVTWKKNTSGTGYQIQYSTDKTFKTGVKTVVAPRAITAKTIKGLTKGKTYYVRVRTYKTTTSGARYYSGWSTVKSAKINK